MPLPSKKSSQVPKSLAELLADPHFLFTMFSLLASVGVFFYYLYQLLFRTKDWRSGETYTPPASRKSSGQKLVGNGGAAATATNNKQSPGDLSADLLARSDSSRLAASRDERPSPSSGGAGSAPSSTSKRRLSQTELVTEMEKKIDALKRRGELRKQLLKEVIEETLAAADDVDDDDGGGAEEASSAVQRQQQNEDDGNAAVTPSVAAAAEHKLESRVEEGADMTHRPRAPPGGELRRRKGALREA